MTMIVTWLIELYLDHLGQLKEEENRRPHEQLQDEFRKLLAQTRVKVIHRQPAENPPKRGFPGVRFASRTATGLVQETARRDSSQSIPPRTFRVPAGSQPKIHQKPAENLRKSTGNPPKTHRLSHIV